MDPLSALSIACNLMQVISFTGETIALCKTIYKRGSADPSLEGNAKTLSIFTKSLRTSLESTYNQAPPSEAEQELRDLASKLLDKTEELKKTLGQIGATSGQANIGKTIQAACRQLYKSGLLRRLEKEVQEYQKALESGLLLRICNANEASSLRNQQGFEKLDSTLQHFIVAISKDQLQLSQLVQTVDKQIENGFLAIRDEATRSRVLKSLKYDGMNFRRSTVKEHHPQTFEWIFKDRLPKYDYRMELDDTESESDAASTISTLSGSPSNSSKVDEDHMHSVFSYETSPPWDSFVEWLRTDDKTYWVSGKPGSGKSTLMLFLLRDFRTKCYLNEWSPDTLVLSHFLLSSGHLLQRNTRGTYCSLLHQLLVDDSEHDGVLLSLLASSFPRILSKDVPDDWAQWELKDVTLAALEHSKRPLCVFIDGLDELVASEIDDGNLWSLLRSLERIPKLKLCLSSRPEPSFRAHFERAPKLEMQLLTDGDIRRYATEFLKSSISLEKRQAQRHEVGEFIRIICERANGVFLWVYLVLKRLRKGMTNNDTMVILNRRLEEIPKELQDLFQDMWGRLGEDAEMSEYLALAARYFHLVRTAESRPVNGFSDGSWSQFTIAELMMATNRRFIRDIVEGNEDQVTAKRIQTACDAVVQNLDICCAGLLECRNDTTRLSYLSPDYWGNEQLKNYHLLGVDFVHRSARDFLFTTQEGAKLLSHDTSTLEDQLVLLCQARMTVASLWLGPYKALSSLPEDHMGQGVVLSQKRMQEITSLGGFLYSRPRLRHILLFLHTPHSGSYENDIMLEVSLTPLVGQIPHYFEMLNQGPSSVYAGCLMVHICQLFSYQLLRHSYVHPETKSTMKRQEAQLATIQYLNDNGASLTFKGPALNLYPGCLWTERSSHVELHSAAVALVESLCKSFAYLQDLWKLAIVELMSKFVNRGADLSTPIVAVISRLPKHGPMFYFDIMVTIKQEDDGGVESNQEGGRNIGSLFFATTPGYLLRLVLTHATPERQDLPSPRLSDLDTAVHNLLDHEAIFTAPPILEALGITSPNGSSAILQADTIPSDERISVLLGQMSKTVLADGSSSNLGTCWDEIRDILSESDVVSQGEFDKELVRRKFFVSKEEYMKAMPRLEAEQEAILMERMREEALEGLEELGRTDI